jgi:hypothetical protein
MADRETAIQNAAKKQMMEMEARLQKLGDKLEVSTQELAHVKHQATEHEEMLQKQLVKVNHLAAISCCNQFKLVLSAIKTYILLVATLTSCLPGAAECAHVFLSQHCVCLLVP